MPEAIAHNAIPSVPPFYGSTWVRYYHVRQYLHANNRRRCFAFWASRIIRIELKPLTVDSALWIAAPPGDWLFLRSVLVLVVHAFTFTVSSLILLRYAPSRFKPRPIPTTPLPELPAKNSGGKSVILGSTFWTWNGY